MYPRSLARLGVVLILVSACSGAGRVADQPTVGSTSSELATSHPPATAAASSATESAALDALLARLVGDADGGAVALVSRDGITTTAATGVANSSGDPLTPQTPFRIMSITKTFVATMVLQLVDEGRVNLDQPLSSYLPDPALGGDVPVRLLLNHRSGLPDYVSHASYTDFTAAVLADRERAFTPEEVLGYVADARAGTPDRFFRYSNTNYILLGQMIEHIDGTDLATSLQTRIANPLDLRATVLPTADQPAPDHLAAGWSTDGLDGDPSIPFDSIESAAWAAGGMISTADDLARFVTALFDGQLISDAMLAEMTDLGAQHYGLGITTADFGSGAAGYFGAGSGFGFGSIMGIYPDTGDVVVVLTNNSAVDVHEIAGHIVGQW